MELYTLKKFSPHHHFVHPLKQVLPCIIVAAQIKQSDLATWAQDI